MVSFPLLLIPLAIYNIIVLLMPGVNLAAPLVQLTLMSGAVLPITLGDVLLSLGILLLLCEIIKGARPGSKYLTDHLLSLIVFGGAAAEFVMLPGFGTPVYGLLGLLAVVEFFSGIALHARRGTPVMAEATASRRSVEPAEPAAASPSEPQFDPPPAPPAPIAMPAKAPSVPPAAAVAESVLSARPEPGVLQSSAPEIPSPEIPSPRLQPGHGPSPLTDEPPR